MEFEGVSYTGKPIKDKSVIEHLPEGFQEFLQYANGIVAFDGGICFKGVGEQPVWASLEAVMEGEFALHKQYDDVTETDIPFACDCLGVVYILRSNAVWRLDTENGYLEEQEEDFWDFINNALEDPEDYLDLELLYDHLDEGNLLKPGELFHINPPFSFEESAEGVEVGVVKWEAQMKFLFELNQKLHNTEEGKSIEIESLI